MGIAGACLWVFRDGLFSEIGPEIAREGVSRGIDYLRITIPFYPVMAFACVISRGLNGAGSTKAPMMIDLFLYLCLLPPLACALSGVGVFGLWETDTTRPEGVWWAAVATHCVAAVAYALVWHRGHWRRKKIAEIHLD